MAAERVSHYELVRLIGRGGMGEVHEALDLKLRRRVALKFLSGELGADRAALTRFEREALAAAELNHPNIATVYAFEPDGERPFIAMELLAGPSLRERIEAGPLAVDEALAIARDVAAALAYAHRRGTSHRDIKPENLMFDEHGAIQVMDFGLARATMASKLTMTGTSLGTPAYMSPESIRGVTGPSSDVFALGLVLYEMLAGHRAYPGDNVMAVMFAIANEDPAPLRASRPEVPEAVEALIARLLAKDPEQRIDAAGAAQELGQLTGVTVSLPAIGESTRAAGAPSTPAPVASSTARTGAMPLGTATISTADTSPVPVIAPSRSRRGTIVLALVGVAVLGSGALLASGVLQGRRAEEASLIQRRGVEAQQAGDVAAARTLFEQALDRDPSNAGALNSLGLLALTERRYASAESLFGAVIRHHRNDATLRSSALFNLGESRLQTQQPSLAVESFREAFALDSSGAERYNNYGWALIENRQAQEALALLERGIARFPGEAFLHKNAGLAALQIGDLPAALRHLDRALQLNPALEEARTLRARALEAAGGSVPEPPDAPETREAPPRAGSRMGVFGPTPTAPGVPPVPAIGRPDSL